MFIDNDGLKTTLIIYIITIALAGFAVGELIRWLL